LTYWIGKIIGITDARTMCDCCRRRGLPHTVALMPLDGNGDEYNAEYATFYSISCTARALGMREYKVTTTAFAAQHERNRLDYRARRAISIYAPLEFAPVDVRVRVFHQRNHYRPGVSALKEIPKLLAQARATLADTTTGPARPARIEDFHRYQVVLTRTGSIDRIQRVRDHKAERQEQTTAAQHRADHIRGTVRIVAALDVESAGDVACADDLTRAWNDKAWQACHV
jgi:hypothetical protein